MRYRKNSIEEKKLQQINEQYVQQYVLCFVVILGVSTPIKSLYVYLNSFLNGKKVHTYIKKKNIMLNDVEKNHCENTAYCVFGVMRI